MTAWNGNKGWTYGAPIVGVLFLGYLIYLMW